MNKFLEGIETFNRNVYPEYKDTFKSLAKQQQPQALFITCSDSRIVPTMLLQADPGDLFICRNAGNMVPPYDDAMGGVAATIEYAVDVLGLRHIVVCGHSDCGAMKALLHPEAVSSLPAVSRWLRHGERARRIASEAAAKDEAGRLRCVTEENVLAQIDHLTTYPCVASGLARGAFDIYGWVYNIPDGTISSYDAALEKFVPFDGTFPTAIRRSRGRNANSAA